MKFKFLPFLAVALALCACKSQATIPYFQDRTEDSGDVTISRADSFITFRPEDRIGILVNCMDPKLTELFNLPIINRYIGGTNTVASQGQVMSYSIDEEGFVEMPVVGKVRIGGLTRTQAENVIKEALVSQNLVKDPIVNIVYLNLGFSLMGEFARPCRVQINKDRYTILDAIAEGGDLTIFAKRENIRVVREENGVQKTYFINLCSAEDVVNSPAYYIHQNDVIYAEPNGMRRRQSTVNGNNLFSFSFWISVASFATSLMTTFKLWK